MTQKPYSQEKIKLNFDNPQLLGGWDKSKERDYRTVLLRKDGLYYLAVMDREHILNNIITDINNKWLKEFDQTDSVYVFKMGSSCQVEKYGYARNEDAELLIIT